MFLCSDGLTRHVSDDEICTYSGKVKILNYATTQLIQIANDRGGQDNISVAIIDYGRGRKRVLKLKNKRFVWLCQKLPVQGESHSTERF